MEGGGRQKGETEGEGEHTVSIICNLDPGLWVHIQTRAIYSISSVKHTLHRYEHTHTHTGQTHACCHVYCMLMAVQKCVHKQAITSLTEAHVWMNSRGKQPGVWVRHRCSQIRKRLTGKIPNVVYKKSNNQRHGVGKKEYFLNLYITVKRFRN